MLVLYICSSMHWHRQPFYYLANETYTNYAFWTIQTTKIECIFKNEFSFQIGYIIAYISLMTYVPFIKARGWKTTTSTNGHWCGAYFVSWVYFCRSVASHYTRNWNKNWFSPLNVGEKKVFWPPPVQLTSASHILSTFLYQYLASVTNFIHTTANNSTKYSTAPHSTQVRCCVNNWSYRIQMVRNENEVFRWKVKQIRQMKMVWNFRM